MLTFYHVIFRENDVTDVLEMDFVDEHESFGVMEQVELKPGGANISVTEDNKAEYIRLLCEHRLYGRVEAQVEAFKKGLHEIVKAEALAIFDERELEVCAEANFHTSFWSAVTHSCPQLLIGGLAEIDVDDWEKHTDYRGYKVSCNRLV